MPYHLEKGPLFATIEALYNDPIRLPVFLHQLWQGKAPSLGSLGLISSSMFPDPKLQDPNDTGPNRRTSMRRDWFGENLAEPQGTQPDWGTPHFEHGGPTFSTGYWSHYYGDVRSIVAQTLMRAGELVLGVDRPDPVPADPPQPNQQETWRVEFFWKCGQPRFEGWVTWRDHLNGGRGQVTVVFATPATPDQVLRKPGGQAEPTLVGRRDKWQGMWVCSHSDHDQYVVITCLPTTSAAWFVPLKTVMFTRGVGPIGTWAPKFGSGGTPDQNNPFEPVA